MTSMSASAAAAAAATTTTTTTTTTTSSSSSSSASPASEGRPDAVALAVKLAAAHKLLAELKRHYEAEAAARRSAVGEAARARADAREAHREKDEARRHAEERLQEAALEGTELASKLARADIENDALKKELQNFRARNLEQISAAVSDSHDNNKTGNFSSFSPAAGGGDYTGAAAATGNSTTAAAAAAAAAATATTTADTPSSSIVAMLHQRFQMNSRELARLEQVVDVCEKKFSEIRGREDRHRKQQKDGERHALELSRALSLAHTRLAEAETTLSTVSAMQQRTEAKLIELSDALDVEKHKTSSGALVEKHLRARIESLSAEQSRSLEQIALGSQRQHTLEQTLHTLNETIGHLQKEAVQSISQTSALKRELIQAKTKPIGVDDATQTEEAVGAAVATGSQTEEEMFAGAGEAVAEEKDDERGGEEEGEEEEEEEEEEEDEEDEEEAAVEANVMREVGKKVQMGEEMQATPKPHNEAPTPSGSMPAPNPVLAPVPPPAAPVLVPDSVNADKGEVFMTPIPCPVCLNIPLGQTTPCLGKDCGAIMCKACAVQFALANAKRREDELHSGQQDAGVVAKLSRLSNAQGFAMSCPLCYDDAGDEVVESSSFEFQTVTPP